MSGEFIKSLIEEGATPGLWDAHAGHFVDLAGNGNDGTPNAAASWEGPGIHRADGATGAVLVSNHASLQLPTFTVVGVFDRLDLRAGNQYIFYKDNQFSFNVNSDFKVYLYDWISDRFSAAVVTSQNKCFAVSLIGGGTGEAYIDGLSVGALSGISTVTGSIGDLQIGGANSTLSRAMIINRVLTETEHAILKKELVDLDLAWSSLCTMAAIRPQLVNKNDPKLISGWDLEEVAGQVPDKITTRDLTIVKQMAHESGILGPGMSGPTLGHLTSGVNPYSSADLGNGYSVECWCRLGSIPAGNRYIQDFVGRMRLLTNAGQVEFTVYDTAPAFQAALSAEGAVRADDLFHVIGTAKANGAVRLYINEVLQSTVDTMIAFNCNGTGRPMTWGNTWNLAAGMEGTVYKPRIYDHELSQEEVSAKYLEGAKAIQFKTDWGFQISPDLSVRGNANRQIGTRNSPFKADAAFTGGIEAEEVNGHLCKVLTCTTAGDVYIPSELFLDCTPTEAAFGGFGGWMYKADASILTWKFIGTDLDPTANGYALVWAADESVVISELGIGNVIAGGTASHSTWHKFYQAHASDGDFDGYIDDVTYGNGNDLTITTSIGMLWSMGIGDKLCLGNVQGNDGTEKKLGVETP